MSRRSTPSRGGNRRWRRGRWRNARWREQSWALVVAVAGLCCNALGCNDPAKTTAPAAPSTTASATAAQVPGGLVLPPRRPFDSNPLKLPVLPVALKKGDRVFAIARRELETAQLGSTLVLRAARVEGMEGSDVTLRLTFGPLYAVHPGYVIVPRQARLRRGANVIANLHGKLRHAVVTNLLRGKILVRYTDMGRKRPDRRLDPEDVGALGSGLEPGAFAVYRTAQQQHHVVLVSRGDYPDGKRRWLVLGYGSAAMIVDEAKLAPFPKRFKTKVGEDVLVAWRGTMVSATVRLIDNPGLYTVKRQRAGAPFTVGPGQIMKR